MRKLHLLFPTIMTILIMQLPLHATKLVEVKVVDRDYLMISFKDGDVEFVDDGLGPTAYTGNHLTENNYVLRYGDALDTDQAALTDNWVLRSEDDPAYGSDGLKPLESFRKSKINGLAQMDWDVDANDFTYEYTLEHHVMLKLPHSLTEGAGYSLEIAESTGSDVLLENFTYDIFQSRTEAIHINLAGYSTRNSVKAADLYMWLGDGGARDYTSFEGNKVYLYDVNSGRTYYAGEVQFHADKSSEAGGHVLIQSDVWTIDFTGFTAPGTYRLAVEGVGCSQDFEIAGDVYADPYKVSALGYFYMRLGQDNLDMTPVPRRPLYIPGVDPAGTRVIITNFSPYHPDWNTYSGDKWDQPQTFAKYIKEGNPENPEAYGGWSDAADWDRHLGHIVNIYDLLLPYILTGGKPDEDDVRIAESGNGIPDLLDEVRQEVDMWLRLRYGQGYSHGVSGPSNNTLYQADNTPMAAWASAANAAMLSDAFRIAGETSLMELYRDSAIAAFRYAGSLDDQMLDTHLTKGLRGRDLKMMAAAFLYNVTGETGYEDTIAAESIITGPDSDFIGSGQFNQLYAMAAYLSTPQAVNYAELQENMVAAAVTQARLAEADFGAIRPSRRSSDSDYSHFHTETHVQRCILAHAVSKDPAVKAEMEDALTLEADWSLGRNSANVIQMTTATTPLEDKRSILQAYTTGRDDGSPGVHPGHTPYMGLGNWGSHMVMGRPTWLTERGYPEISEWPRSEAYYDVRYVYAHSEFTPAQTMGGKLALYAYLWTLGQDEGEMIPLSGLELLSPDITIEGSAEETLEVSLSPSDATNRFLIWESLDEEVATVDYQGVVKGKSGGNTKVVVSSMDGTFTDTCEVTVNAVALSGITLEPDSLNLVPGQQAALEVSFQPENALNRNFTWTVLDPSVAEVDEYGTLTTKAEGSTLILVTSEEGGFTDTCTLVVEALPDQLVIFRDEINLMSFTWTDNATLEEVEPGGYEGTRHLHFDYELVNWWAGWGFGFDIPLDVTRYKYFALSIRGPSVPAHNVYVTMTDSAGGRTDALHLERSASYQTYMISLDELLEINDIDMSILSEMMLGMAGAPTGLGEYFVDDMYFIASDDPVLVTELQVTPAELSLNEGEKGQLDAVVGPSSATDKTVNWISLDPSVATVDGNGMVTARSSGSAGIVAQAADGSVVDTSMITVLQIFVTGISVSPESHSLGVNDRVKLSATLEPEDASEKGVEWSSSDEAVATVNSQGWVTGKMEGSAVITATSMDGGFSASADIMVLSTSMDDLQDQGSLKLYPNPMDPSTRELLISGVPSGELHIRLIDFLGRSILKERLEVHGHETTITLPDLKSGLHIVHLAAGDRHYVRKLMVTR